VSFCPDFLPRFQSHFFVFIDVVVFVHLNHAAVLAHGLVVRLFCRVFGDFERVGWFDDAHNATVCTGADAQVV